MIESRPQSRAAVSKLKVILSKDLHNDALQCKKMFEEYGKQSLLPELVSTPPQNPAVFQDIFTALGEIRVLFGAPQQGGGDPDIEALKQFVITPLTNEQYAQRSLQPPLEEPLPLLLGSYYRDQKSLPYSVVDDYIITKEDLATFQRFMSISRISSEDEKFLATRLMLLYTDILQGDMERLVATEDDESNGVPSDVKATGHRRIYSLASQLQDIYNKFLEKGQWKNAFQDAFNEYEGMALIDNESVNAIATGRDGLRNPNDYDKTFKKIETLRNGILTTIVIGVPEKLGKRKRTGGRKTRRTKKHF